MENIRLIIKNDLQMIYPVRKAANAYASMLGFQPKDCSEIELVIEEVISNVIKFDFIPGQVEDIEVVIEKSTLGLSISIKSRSIPMDVERIRSFENMDAEEIIRQNGPGLGTLLVKSFADSVNYINKGKEGQEIVIEKYLPAEMVEESVTPQEAEQPEGEKKEFAFYVRKFRPEDAPAICRLAYYTYQLTYYNDQIYYPDRVIHLNESGEMVSFVAVKSDNEEIIGHTAIIREEMSGMVEIGAAFVNPVYRNAGCLKAISIQVYMHMMAMKVDGAFINAVTTHPYSQMPAVKYGIKESALFVSRNAPLEEEQIKKNVYRKSLLFMFKKFSEDYHKTLYAPEHHKNMLKLIYEHVGIDYDFRTTTDDYNISEPDSSLRVKTDKYMCSHITVDAYGKDIVSLTRQTLKSLCAGKIESIYMYLPLNDPATYFSSRMLEELGFFFGGIRPGYGEKDWLLLQYLNNQIYPYENLQFATDFARMLAQYIKERDPSQG